MKTTSQQPDTQPGQYYVSVIDGKRHALLLGPFTNDNAGALAMVDRVRDKCSQLNPWSDFYAFGTCRLPAECTTPGRLNSYFMVAK